MHLESKSEEPLAAPIEAFPPSWKDGGQKQFFVNIFLNTYFRGKMVDINVILKTIFYKICSIYFFRMLLGFDAKAAQRYYFFFFFPLVGCIKRP